MFAIMIVAIIVLFVCAFVIYRNNQPSGEEDPDKITRDDDGQNRKKSGFADNLEGM